jgi:hypothetical protein
MDAPRLAFCVGILTADDDAGMLRPLEVKSDEVAPVQSQHRSTQRSCEGQYLGVWCGFPRLTRLLRRQNVVAQPAEALDDLQWEVLIGEERRHGSGGFVLGDGLIDLLAMRLGVGPCLNQIGGAQFREVLQDPGLAPAQPPVVDQHPNGNPCPDDSRLASCNSRSRLDARPCAAQIEGQTLHHGCLLGPAQSRKFGLEVPWTVSATHVERITPAN